MLTGILFGLAGLAGLGIAGTVVGLNWRKIELLFHDVAVSSRDTAVVCVGMQSSKAAGNCPGAGLDANNMYSLLKPYASGGITLLQSQQATYSAVWNALAKALQHDLCIFFYSGHGGRDSKGSKGAVGETDNRNEYLCLYDRFMVDDALWNLIVGSKGRVVCIFDCCHSGTMYRSLNTETKESIFYGDHPFTFSRYLRMIEEKRKRLDERRPDCWRLSMSHDEVDAVVARERDELERGTPKLLSWAAAREFEYSYGGDSGGIFTNALLVSYGKNRSYNDVWSRLVKRMKGQPNVPVKTQFSEGFGGKVFT